MIDPVRRLDSIFVDNLGEAIGVFSNSEIERTLLGVAPGTVTNLLIEIAARDLWSSLYQVALRHPDEWMLDLTEFFPQEERFIEPLLGFLRLARTEYGKIGLAQNADIWPWGPSTIHRVAEVRRSILEFRAGLSPQYAVHVGPNLERVEKALGQRLLGSECADDGER